MRASALARRQRSRLTKENLPQARVLLRKIETIYIVDSRQAKFGPRHAICSLRFRAKWRISRQANLIAAQVHEHEWSGTE